MNRTLLASKETQRKTGLIVTLTGVVLCFQNCAPANKVAFADADSLSLKPGQVVFETFDVSTTQVAKSLPVDMIWVIDNSGSMSEEAAHVRANLTRFTTQLKSFLDVRFLLISKAGTTGQNVSLPTGLPSSQFRQINTKVDSTNGASLMISKVAEFRAANPTFLRAEAKKIIVFVSDDNSSMSSTSLMNNLNLQFSWIASQVSIFAFTGEGFSKSPCQYRTGSEYLDMANETGAAIYNICATDWTAHFAKLTDNVASIASVGRQFQLLSRDVAFVNSVVVNGVLLPEGSYSVIQGGTLVLADSVNLLVGSQVEIEYISN